ncbi:FAD-binding 9 siderophore-interacting domain protein [Beutenbergia cavernae DSM 12333]|uniref:FAD-binding 9 siderophore-interacting domain protein n=1 Tax=Beutenbergia cavernae (strain ATCC BAA-8 / DSM 12333 / CCUG 43141 / JCM 11478 / NBRC 16432 / NCIMB 13614 / HKI 0122) TaxID=471853 RepID=C5BVF6_BEUC1|nr:siderophore-interacting protein [Beutenbergia cavernae]ACQ80543.1 FAD-binding 9 siderophore-interacting domain protein [Beutenbergia cavernae DSM 12333]
MTTTAVASPYRMFDVRVRRLERLGHSLLRVTFAGVDLDRFADPGLDTRIKVILPLPDSRFVHLDRSSDWYATWRTLEESQRNPIRTYTTRLVRPEVGEVDIDFVLHGDGGPASAWATQASVGDEVVLLGPNADHPGPYHGLEFAPHAGATSFLVAGDETALPAVARILEDLTLTDPGSVGDAVLEVPSAGDVLDLVAPDGVRVTWVVRESAPHGERLVAAVQAAAAALLATTPSPSLADASEPADVDVDAEILWEVPVSDGDAAGAGLYAWLAGEAGAIKTLRRHLVRVLGVDKSQVAFMGYWRIGRAEG